MRKEAVLYLPGKSLQEVEQHEDWYRELLELQDQKREVHRGEGYTHGTFSCHGDTIIMDENPIFAIAP